MKKCECEDKNPFIAIPAAMGGIFLVLAVVFLIFAREQLGLLIPLIWGFVVLGIVAMGFQLRAMRNK